MELSTAPLAALILIAIASWTLFVIQSSMTHDANAQSVDQLPAAGSEQQQPSANITASISLIPTLIEAIKSEIRVSLNNATTAAMNSVGENSTALLSSLQPERGYLVYRVFVLDANNNVYMVLVDPADGKIVSEQQLPSEVLGTMLSGIPIAGSQFSSGSPFIGP